MTITRILACTALMMLIISPVMAEDISFHGENLQYFPSFSIDKSVTVSADALPSDAVGLYGSYAVYNGDGSTSPNVLAFMRRANNPVGALVLNTIIYSCKSHNLACAPLSDMDVTVRVINQKVGLYQAIIPNIQTWFAAYDILRQSTDIKKFAPSFDKGAVASVQ